MIRTIVILLLISTQLHAQEITVGRTWDIVEPDPIDIAKNKAANVDPKRLEPKSTFRERLRAKNIGRSQVENKRSYTPSYTTDKSILDKDGNIIYPVGFTYNPIEFMYKYTRRIVIIDEQDAEAVKSKLLPSDILIMNNGDLTKISNLLNRRVSMLDLLTAESMNIVKVPVFITIDYDALTYRLTEFNPETGVPL